MPLQPLLPIHTVAERYSGRCACYHLRPHSCSLADSDPEGGSRGHKENADHTHEAFLIRVWFAGFLQGGGKYGGELLWPLRKCRELLEALAETDMQGLAPEHPQGYSLLPVFTNSPPSSCWLTPAQWQQFLARRQRHNPGSSLSLLYLPDKPPARSLSMVQASSLKPTDGIRWLSGPERLAIMGFASDWMRPTLQRLKLPATPLCRKSWNGSPGS